MKPEIDLTVGGLLIEIPIDDALPAHQRQAIDELAGYRRTGWIRRAFTTYAFSAPETRKLVALVKVSLPLKRRTLKAQRRAGLPVVDF